MRKINQKINGHPPWILYTAVILTILYAVGLVLHHVLHR